MTSELRMFGGVHVVIDGRVVDLGHARQRCVLALLMVQANQSVSADELVEQAWGEHPPPRGRDALYTYVSRLRAALAAAADVEIAHDARGYRLVVDETIVDLHRFRALVARARGDDLAALALLDEAVALSRGEPFAGVDSPWLAKVRADLVAERHAAELDRTDLALRHGRYADLVADLSVRVAERPVDERLAGQYLLALYRTGRQADAIAHYQRIRTTLGRRPSHTLEAIYRRILTGENPGTSASRAPVPRQLPPAPAWFTGRAAELAALSRIVDAATSTGQAVAISAVAGTGGIGKTWLALYWAYQCLDRFPDGQLFVDLRGFTPAGQPVAPADAVRGFLDGLGVPPDRIPVDLAAQTALYHRGVAGKRLLIVLDNAVDAAQVTPLIPDSPTCTVLITSRRHLPSVHNVLLDVLSEAEARDLLAARLGADRVAAEAAAVETLLACCGGFPLALGIVIGRALTHPDLPLSALAAELGDHTRALEALDTGDAVANLSAVLSWSVRALPAEQARVFALLGIAPGPDISLPAAASLAALSPDKVSVVLRELENVSLIQQHLPGRYRMHDLVRRYATDIAGDEREAALPRVLDFYNHTAHTADRALYPHRAPLALDPPAPGARPLPMTDGRAALAWFDSEYPALLAAQHAAAGHGRPITVWQLARSLSTFHIRRGHFHDRLAMWQAALRVVDDLPDPAGRPIVHLYLGRSYADLGSHDASDAHLHQALALAEEQHDRQLQAQILRTFGWAAEQRRDYRQALYRAKQTLNLYRSLDQPVWEADALNMIGWYSALLGEYDTGRDHCQAALTLHRLHHSQGAAATLDSLGYIEHHSGHHRQAVDYYQQSLAMYREFGDNAQGAKTLENLGHPFAALGEHAQARAVWQEALQLYQEQGRDSDADRVREQLAALDHELGGVQLDRVDGVAE